MNEPRPWTVKYDGVCSRCRTPLLRGTPAIWERTTRTLRCIECPTQSSASPPAVDYGVAGRSARAEAERRAATREREISERWGDGFVGSLVRAFSDEPQSTRAWAIGAAGEEKVAAELATVPGLKVLNDRRVPGTRGNIDHIVIAPAGVFVVDAKNYRGRIEIRDRGGFLTTDERLYVGRRDCSRLVDGLLRQLDPVRAALRDTVGVPVTPVLCFVDGEWPLFGSSGEYRGVRLESERSLKTLVTRQDVFNAVSIERLAAMVARALPRK